MPNRIPFFAYFRIVPERGEGKRFEIDRSRHRISHLVWKDLNDNLEDSIILGDASPSTDTGANFAAPGGGMHWGIASGSTGYNESTAIANTVPGVAVKPQFGEFPDVLTVIGFYEKDIHVPYREKRIISVNKTWDGPASGARAFSDNTSPTSDNENVASDLKNKLENAISSVNVNMIALDIGGVRYGYRGLHFPR